MQNDPSTRKASVPQYGYQIIKIHPHDPEAFTQGLFYLNGFLYEGTGLKGRSSVRKTELTTGEVVQKSDLPEEYFGEGIVNWKDRILQLTWTSQTGFIYDLASLQPIGQFSYRGEGWGLAHDGRQIIMSDGSSELRFLDPESLQEIRRITVIDNGCPVPCLNDLQWVEGEIYANVFKTDRIARINPETGNLTGWINLHGMLNAAHTAGPLATAVTPSRRFLNGIAFDPAGGRLFVTGKLWPKLFEIRLVNGSDQTLSRSFVDPLSHGSNIA